MKYIGIQRSSSGFNTFDVSNGSVFAIIRIDDPERSDCINNDLFRVSGRYPMDNPYAQALADWAISFSKICQLHPKFDLQILLLKKVDGDLDFVTIAKDNSEVSKEIEKENVNIPY